MRHSKHKHLLGVKKEHRTAIVSQVASALFRHDRIETTLATAKAVRPFAEKVITLAKKAAASDDKAVKLHFRRLAISKLRDESAVAILFDKKVEKFLKRLGGYTRIYKLVPRKGDSADVALLELIEADDQGYKKVAKKKTAKKTAKKKVAKEVETAEAVVEAVEAEAKKE